ncbi:pilus assembly protein TadG-related protein [uncultured Demequina sp.]|uniref:pilus assembly protein TadG-related protein n=1 Tax=uncultured Demequina sp. TaxID=693499 RepID=UPI0025E1F37F|nr:pilus assembly protein TadG-related protein [uncultured Demequina sp.]
MTGCTRPPARAVRDRAPAFASDAGSVSLFTLGWIVVALMAVAVLVGATQVHVNRMRLVSLADECAVAAAGHALAADYFASDGETADVVLARLAGDDRPWVDDVRVVAVRTDDDSTAQVVLTRTVLPLVGGWGWLPDVGVTLTASGSARIG